MTPSSVGRKASHSARLSQMISVLASPAVRDRVGVGVGVGVGVVVEVGVGVRVGLAMHLLSPLG